MKTLTVKSFGPIANADVRFGDLTLLVGEQASGKSIFLQLLKLLVDKSHIQKTVEQYNYVWGKDITSLLNLFFGEGMASIWKPSTAITFDKTSYTKEFLLTQKNGRKGSASKEESLFYIPAQRILSVADGRPKPFTEFDSSAPFVLRQFSETLRQLLQNGMGKMDAIFPAHGRLKEPIADTFNQRIFHDGRVVLDDRSGQKKLRLNLGDMSIPFMTWSAGQKEFMPLLLAFYLLCPPSNTSRNPNASRKALITSVVIEEPEMGLHPEAIKAVILQILDLLARGYQVIVSTHSPVFLEFAWAFSHLKKSNAPEKALLELFDISKVPDTKRFANGILHGKEIKTYYFERVEGKVKTRDISTLDAGSPEQSIAEWGGISSFAGRAADIVSKYFLDET
jgi:energy-coupling factor transporter ATP-binding protein EcfA2